MLNDLEPRLDKLINGYWDSPSCEIIYLEPKASYYVEINEIKHSVALIDFDKEIKN